MDSELGMNEENYVELSIKNEMNNGGLITSRINLTDRVKNTIDNLVIEHFRHTEYQSSCFEELINTSGYTINCSLPSQLTVPVA